MSELEAARWLEQQAGARIDIGENGQITITDGCSVKVTGTGFLDAVIQMQSVLSQMRDDS
jgi:hypothetical protein